MPDLKKYWQDLRAIEQSLPEYVWLTNRGGMVQTGAAVAAKLLYAKSHRLATEDETQEYLALQQDIRRQQFQQRLRDRGIAVVPVER
jgi:hypothetical protein